MKQIQSFIPFLQKSFGNNNCTLTSIMTVLYNLLNRQYKAKVIYDIIEKNGIKYGYNSESWGSIPIFTNIVINKSYQDITNKSIKSKVKYFKGIGYNFNTIKEQIDNNNPIILSVNKAGKYTNHTVVIIGYNEETNELLIHDNWRILIQKIKYDGISFISSINYI